MSLVSSKLGQGVELRAAKTDSVGNRMRDLNA